MAEGRTITIIQKGKEVEPTQKVQIIHIGDMPYGYPTDEPSNWTIRYTISIDGEIVEGENSEGLVVDLPFTPQMTGYLDWQWSSKVYDLKAGQTIHWEIGIFYTNIDGHKIYSYSSPSPGNYTVPSNIQDNNHTIELRMTSQGWWDSDTGEEWGTVG